MLSPAIKHILRYRSGGNSAFSALTFRGIQQATGTSSTQTVTSADLGTADPNRQVIVFFTGSSFTSVTSVTVGGVTATSVATGSDGAFKAFIYIANVPTGTTGNIVVTVSDSIDFCDICWYTVNMVSATAHATASGNGTTSADSSLTLNIPANGFVICGISQQAGSDLSFTPNSGYTEDNESFNSTFGTNNLALVSKTSTSAETSASAGGTWSASDYWVGAAASWNGLGT